MSSVLRRFLSETVAAALVAALAAVLVVAVPTSAAAATATVGDLTYSYDSANPGAGATITNYLGSGTIVNVPGTVTIGADTYNVTTIGDWAFYDNALTSVTIPNSVTTIGEGAMYDNALTSVTIPISVTTIGDYAFEHNSLTSVTIPDSVTTIGYGTFAFNSLTSVSIPNSVTTIGASAFYSNLLTSVAIPNSVTSIWNSAFAHNVLTSVTIPNSVTSIFDGAFAHNALTSVTIPNSVTTIGEYAFAYNALTSVIVPNSVTTVNGGAFADNALTSVTIPNSVTTIDGLAFANNALTSVTIPDSVTTIWYGAFDENPLESVVMEGPVPSTIGIRPFGYAGATAPLVTFFSTFASSGYTTPTWTAGGQAYASQSTVRQSIVTMTPTRIADLGNVTPGVVRCVPVVGLAGVPAGASGVILNVTTSMPGAGGNVVVYPDYAGNGASTPPSSSTVNFEKDQDVANAAFVALPTNGDVCAFTQGSMLSRLILDVTGYVLPGSGVTLQNSQRLMDTRGGSFPAVQAGPVQPNDIRTIQVTGNVGVPAGATAVLVNVTVTDVAAPGHLRMWAAGTSKPNTSVLNYAAGKDKANAQIVALSADGQISFESFSSGSTHVIIDVVGYVSGSTQYVATAPTRIVETRSAFGLIGPIGGQLAPNTIYPVTLSDTSLVPTGATAVVLNVTAVQPSGPGHLRVYPDTNGLGTTTPPDASTLNYIPGRDIPNLVIVQLPANRTIDFYNVLGGSDRTDLVVDVVGYVYGGA